MFYEETTGYDQDAQFPVIPGYMGSCRYALRGLTARFGDFSA